jgi:hypothetical protein
VTYRVQITAGARTWDVHQGDDPATCDLLDPLTISWAYPDDATYPAQPEPVVLQFSVLAPDAHDMDDVSLGDPVTARLDLAAAGYPVRFLGMITDLEASPHSRGVRYDVICTDATVDLANAKTSPRSLATQSFMGRLDSLFVAGSLATTDLEANTAVVNYTEGGAGEFAVLVNADTGYAGGEVLRDAVVALCDWIGGLYQGSVVPSHPSGAYFRPIIAPLPGVSSYGAPFKFVVDDVANAYTSVATDFPARLDVKDNGLWGPVYDQGSDPVAGWIDSCEVDADDAAWLAARRIVATRAKVSILQQNAPGAALVRTEYTQNSPAGVPAGRLSVTNARTTEMVGIIDAPYTGSLTSAIGNALNLSDMMIPPPPVNAGWAPQAFTWHPARDLDYWPPLFPDHGAAIDADARTLCYRRPYTLGNVKPEWNVSAPDTDSITALMTSVSLTIAAGRLEVTFTMSPSQVRYAPGSTGGLRWQDVGAAAPTWGDLDPADTWADYDHVGQGAPGPTPGPKWDDVPAAKTWDALTTTWDTWT